MTAGQLAGPLCPFDGGDHTFVDLARTMLVPGPTPEDSERHVIVQECSKCKQVRPKP